MMRARQTADAIRPLMPALVDIQRNLDARLSLARLASELGYSPYHFHRLFTEAVGETPRAHVERLRMEKAAYKLWITSEPVVDIALSVGFRSHETFSRAFRRHFGVTPQSFRSGGRPLSRPPIPPHTRWTADDCVLSDVRYQSLRELPLLAIRYVGPYDETPQPAAADDRYWRTLIDWVRQKRVSYQPIAVAIFHDNPWLTPRAQQRADLCIPVSSVPAGSRSIRCTRLPPGMYAAITHMGPPPTRHQAFRRLADTVHASTHFTFPSEPAGAISMSPLSPGESAVDYTDVYLSVIPQARVR
jgi:AraC family transcriptional regulator